jgi:hypothetical protein
LAVIAAGNIDDVLARLSPCGRAGKTDRGR